DARPRVRAARKKADRLIAVFLMARAATVGLLRGADRPLIALFRRDPPGNIQRPESGDEREHRD
ncbi:MAG TPA: hypothetical protein VJZ91_02905, partial [Blastocatellia bacterium]|nr:hypothetical protein [Blastocatellia bacterium]